VIHLVIDTALDRCTTALVRKGEIIADSSAVIGRGHAEALPLQLQALFARQPGIRPDAIMVCVGPGSFTGVRIGIAAARALGLVWQVPVTGANALHASGHGARPLSDAPLMIAHGAGRGLLYACRMDGTSFGPLLHLPAPDVAQLALSEKRHIAGSGSEAMVAAGPALGDALLPVSPWPAPLDLLACAPLPAEAIYSGGPALP
jgi:tRNA threonylcarbamoyladenosine biosynthesis protein TsaB